ncbi:tRNA pseudouridine(13) synthase TruD [Candidatus Woesearchaeota archaeon]|nr:tRNA pseudouridine(13) synthase TruD [Candidatus Woesearchaeota archaeon]
MYRLKQIPKDFIVREINDISLKKNGKYSVLLLKKRNYTTQRAVKKISETINVPVKKIGYSGNKDKRAVTYQYISIPGRINDLNFKDISLEFKGFSDSELYIGSLIGNEFEITIRNIYKKPKKAFYLVNYFDEQRFSKNNAKVGEYLIKKQFKKAVSLVENEKVINHLEKFPNDHLGAFKTLAFRIQKIYIHAYQSYLWNMAACQYVKSKTDDYHEVDYSLGKFVFTDEKIKNISLPLICFDTEFIDEHIRKNYIRILDKEGISLRDFILRKMKWLTPQGSERDLIAEIDNLKVGKLDEDELNPGKKKVKISFFLKKGSYATLFVKKLFSKDIQNSKES